MYVVYFLVRVWTLNSSLHPHLLVNCFSLWVYLPQIFRLSCILFWHHIVRAMFPAWRERLPLADDELLIQITKRSKFPIVKNWWDMLFKPNSILTFCLVISVKIWLNSTNSELHLVGQLRPKGDGRLPRKRHKGISTIIPHFLGE